jgi:hypothetical protein
MGNGTYKEEIAAVRDGQVRSACAFSREDISEEATATKRCTHSGTGRVQAKSAVAYETGPGRRLRQGSEVVGRKIDTQENAAGESWQ